MALAATGRRGRLLGRTARGFARGNAPKSRAFIRTCGAIPGCCFRVEGTVSSGARLVGRCDLAATRSLTAPSASTRERRPPGCAVQVIVHSGSRGRRGGTCIEARKAHRRGCSLIAVSERIDETPHRAVLGAAKMSLAAPAASDGYRPIAESLAMWALLMGSPPEDQFRLVLAAARRLDTAHRQLQRVREGLAAEHLGVGSPLGRRQILEVVGDAETAMVALNKALRIALTIPGSFRVNVGVPREISQRAGFVERMRDHYEHIEARAVGKIKDRRTQPKPLRPSTTAP